MTELTRITISLETSLLDAFDKHIAGKGYENRSEAIRDLIRDKLIQEEAKNRHGEQVAVVAMVFDHHARELASKLIDKQHIGNRVVRKYDTARTPYQRVLEREEIPLVNKAKLINQYLGLNPAELRRHIDERVAQLWSTLCHE